ncbi:hypothetical protein FHR84_002877 [Actinopolyspora biskrensis]|uniref:Uncharacterized protein n=1 Tax=Actinopolyspora biskrensis TaxID=1470178 RepID=A0A852Z199_9ACTN|nr:hypothetical protein [Actinopolyspora biskrensis]
MRAFVPIGAFRPGCRFDRGFLRPRRRSFRAIHRRRRGGSREDGPDIAQNELPELGAPAHEPARGSAKRPATPGESGEPL